MLRQAAPRHVSRLPRHRWLWLAAWWLAIGPLAAGLALAQPPAAAAEAPAAAEAQLGDQWVRLHYDDEGQLQGMQTAIVRYRGTAGPDNVPVEVDLIGAVHIGDAAYYHKLNELFKQYDALLYELVAPEGAVVAAGRGSSSAHPVGAMQNAMSRVLELDHQLDKIDYTPGNFVHADMSPQEFTQAMRDRNESFLQMYFRLMGQALAQQSEMAARGESLDADLISALFAKDRPRRLKIALAKQLAQMESMMVSFGGEHGSVIITERNRKAFDVLRQQLDAGKQRLGVFYGAGHLIDMHERLREDFGLQPVAITWLTAWNLAP